MSELLFLLTMKDQRILVEERIANISQASLKLELDRSSSKYHFLAAWIAIIFNPIFGITDYFNIPDKWLELMAIRLSISVITLITLNLGRRNNWSSATIVIVPFGLISLQNAFAFSLIGNEDIVGHSINYIALLIGGAIFILWELKHSLSIISISIVATVCFILINSQLDLEMFMVKGGMLLLAVAVFMVISIKTRYDLTVKEIKARLALEASNEEIQTQAEQIMATNENLELLVKARTQDLERKNKALEEYAWINAHKLRSPVASILGLMNILGHSKVEPETRVIMDHLKSSTEKLDEVVSSITDAIENADLEDGTPIKMIV